MNGQEVVRICTYSAFGSGPGRMVNEDEVAAMIAYLGSSQAIDEFGRLPIVIPSDRNAGKWL